MVVPVPHSMNRHDERGKNHIAVITHPVSLQMGRVYSSRILAGKKYTLIQAGLPATVRKKNGDGAFSAGTNLTTGKSILFIDDVGKSRSTFSAALCALVEAGLQECIH